jgi:hypothetical protein
VPNATAISLSQKGGGAKLVRGHVVGHVVDVAFEPHFRRVMDHHIDAVDGSGNDSCVGDVAHEHGGAGIC